MAIGWIFVGCGLFAICGAIGNWDWFMNHRKARAFVRLAGRAGARIFYGFLGSALVVLGVLIALGVIEST